MKLFADNFNSSGHHITIARHRVQYQFVNVNAFSPFHCQFQSQQTLQLITSLAGLSRDFLNSPGSIQP